MFQKPPEQPLTLFSDPPSLQMMLFVLAVILVAVLMRDGVSAALRHYDRWLSPKNRFTKVNFKAARNGVGKSPALAVVPNLGNPVTQVEAITLVGFQTTPTLNREEARLLPILEAAVKDFASGHRLMAQISLGELIRPCTDSAFTRQATLDAACAAINSKRLDFAVINPRGHLVAAIEYHGSGHFQTNAVLRDAVKREALRKAGVAMIEILPTHSPEHIRAQLRDALTSKGPGFAAKTVSHHITQSP